MNATEIDQTEVKVSSRPKVSPKAYEGIYHSNSINQPVEEVYMFLQNKSNLTKALSDLPEKIKNFIVPDFSAADALDGERFQVVWKNSAEPRGTLTFNLSPAPGGRGTIVIANGIFGDYTMDDDEPSDLINLFLKRIKALSETGQIATTTGQPNGKDEDELKNEIKH